MQRLDLNSGPKERVRSRQAVVRAAGIVLLAGLLAACATHSGIEPDSDVDHSGRMRGYVESSKVTDFCPDQGSRRDDERCVVTRGWDYDRGVTIVRTYDPDGRLIGTVEPPGANLSLVPEEKARVETLVRSDPRTSAIVNKPGVLIWTGGFVMREPGDPWCDKGSRCIRAIAYVGDGQTTVLHSVVDLMRDQVVYPDYVPSGKKLSDHNEVP